MGTTDQASLNISIIALALSAAALAWNAISWVRSGGLVFMEFWIETSDPPRAHNGLRAPTDRIPADEYRGRAEGAVFVIAVRNRGRSAITVEEVGILFSSPTKVEIERLPPTESGLPATIHAGEPAIEFRIELATVRWWSEKRSESAGLVRVWSRLATGRTRRSRARELRSADPHGDTREF
jgi:hypothetical protein